MCPIFLFYGHLCLWEKEGRAPFKTFQDKNKAGENTIEKQINANDLETRLLAWYSIHRRNLPWRAAPDSTPDPYHVWLSEIMLQQTTVAVVRDYFLRFIAAWPAVEDLAKASLDEIFHKWQGLGYYSRARNLHRCAQILTQDFKGILPSQEATLLTLPGIGPYTAAAIAAIAYEQPMVPVDGNVIRVFSRLFALETPLPDLKNEVQSLVKPFAPSQRRGDFAQGLMDLGSLICRPRKPLCAVCPLQEICKGHLSGIAGQLPRPAKKALKPVRYGVVFWLENPQGKILLEKRPDKGLLAGLMGLPGTVWRETPWPLKEALRHAPAGAKGWATLPYTVRHTFTHFHLVLTIVKGRTGLVCADGIWDRAENFKDYAFPTVMKKVIHDIPATCENLGKSTL